MFNSGLSDFLSVAYALGIASTVDETSADRAYESLDAILSDLYKTEETDDEFLGEDEVVKPSSTTTYKLDEYIPGEDEVVKPLSTTTYMFDEIGI